MLQKLSFENRVHLPLLAQPIRQGVPWPQGVLQPDVPLAARAEDGSRLPLSSRTLNCWSDGSVQWSLLDLSLDFAPSGKRTVIVDSEAGTEAASLPRYPVVAAQHEQGVGVSNGLTEIMFSNRPGQLIESWTATGRPVTPENGFDVVLTDTAGTQFTITACSHKTVWLEDANPLRAVVRVDGKHEAPDGSALIDFWLRFVITAGRADVKVSYHYRNKETAEPGIILQSMEIKLRSALPTSAERAIVHSNRTRYFRTEPYRLPEDFEIIASNTPDLETYPATHQGITGGGAGRIFLRQHELLRDDAPKPWFMQNVADFKFGNVFPPEWSVWSYLGLVSDAGSLLVVGGNMVGLHPKSLGVAGNVVTYAIWPQWAGPMDITQGEGRTLDLYIGPLPPNASDQDLMNQYFSWEFSNLYGHYPAQPPLKISMDVAHLRRCAVFATDKLPAYDPHEHFAFERKVANIWTPGNPVPAHGHWHYGDVFVNYATGGNNEEMNGWMWFQEYLRSGRPECLDIAMAQAQHILDVDIVMYSNDPFQNGGMCAHGPRHNHCAAYGSHMWFTELLCAYALTGDEEFKKGAMRVCDNLTWWANDPVGFSLLSGDGRESGQPLINLAWTYQFAPEQRYLDAMCKIVREAFMTKVEKYGRLVYPKPREDLTIIMDDSYGQWAAWEGLYWTWEVTRDENLRQFMLSQLEWRLTEERMQTHGSFRATDFNVAAYAYLMTGDQQWLDRVSRAFHVAFRAAEWQFGYIKSMYFIKLAFEHGIIRDDDVIVS